jgi:drug/metabolite transporter (DMT)-like permease
MDAPQPGKSEPAGLTWKSRRVPHAATQAYGLLVFTMACWGGNSVAGRLAVGQISPMVITCLRWALVSIFLVGLMRRNIIQALPTIRREWRQLALMAVCGFSLFNALFYVAAHLTTAVNISILQGSVPVFVVLGSLVLYGTRVGALQAAGIVATLVGVAVVATQGHLASLAAIHFNLGDGLILAACFLYAGYTLALRHRPQIPALVFFAALAVIAFLTSLPFLAYELVTATVQWPTREGWAILFYIAIFPSFLAQVAFIRAVHSIGPSRAGLFANLVPLFGAGLAVLILDEHFALFHLIALVLIVGGIFVAETAGRLDASAAARDAERTQSN